MRLIALIVICGVLAACGVTATTDNPEKTSFFMVSKGKASSLYRWFAGDIDYCKVTQHNLKGVEFTGDIEYTEDGCKVGVTAGAASD